MSDYPKVCGGCYRLIQTGEDGYTIGYHHECLEDNPLVKKSITSARVPRGAGVPDGMKVAATMPPGSDLLLEKVAKKSATHDTKEGRQEEGLQYQGITADLTSLVRSKSVGVHWLSKKCRDFEKWMQACGYQTLAAVARDRDVKCYAGKWQHGPCYYIKRQNVFYLWHNGGLS